MFKRFHPIMVLVFEYIDLSKHRIRSAAQRAERASIITSSVYSYLRSSYGGRSARGRVLSFLRRLHLHLFFFSFHMFERFHRISIWTYISRNIDHEAQRAERASVYNILRLFLLSALSLASPVHSYGGYARPFSFTFLYTHTIPLPYIVSLFHR